MEEKLISYKIAKLAKEKNFNQKVFFSYECKEKPILCCGGYYGKKDINEHGYIIARKYVLHNYNSRKNSNAYSAPTQTLLQKWLREKHDIDVFVLPVRYTGYLEIGYYTYSIKGEQPVGKEKYKFDTWEDALEIALEKGLKLIG
jgi:hypothetical protein